MQLLAIAKNDKTHLTTNEIVEQTFGSNNHLEHHTPDSTGSDSPTTDEVLPRKPTTILRTLWEALMDTNDASVPMAITQDPLCGLELRTTRADGEMRNKSGLVLNMRMGGLTPLIMATLAGRVDVMEAILKKDVDVNAREHTNDDSALHVAAITGNATAIQLLLCHSADINAKNCIGYTPLHAAIFNGQLEAIHMLVDNEADLTCVTAANNLTPLQLFRSLARRFQWSREAKQLVDDQLTPLPTGACDNQCYHTSTECAEEQTGLLSYSFVT